MRRLLVLLVPVLAPLAAGALTIQHAAAVDAAAGTPAVTLAPGDLGTATLHASGTGASVAVASLPSLVSNDVLRLQGGPTGWSVRAELVSHSGWGSLEEITIRLSDGSTSPTQVRVSSLGTVQSTGTPLAFTTGTDVELRVIGKGTGSVVLDLVLDPAASVELRYRVTLTVG